MTALAALLALCAAEPSGAAEPSDGEALLQGFFDTWKTMRTVTYRLDKLERLRNGEVTDEAVFVKFRKPLAVYLGARKPRRGQEIVYDSRADPNEFTVHPGRFPDFTLDLDLRGSLATDRQHHLVSHTGFSYLVEMIQLSETLNPGRSRARNLGNGIVRGREVARLSLEVEPRPHRQVKAREGESIFAFAERVGMDAYYIFYSNRSIDEFTDELEAREYAVPWSYGTRTEIVLDVETMLPVKLTVWDHHGRIYEQLTYTNVVPNARLSDADFDADNPAYNF